MGKTMTCGEGGIIVTNDDDPREGLSNAVGEGLHRGALVPGVRLLQGPERDRLYAQSELNDADGMALFSDKDLTWGMFIATTQRPYIMEFDYAGGGKIRIPEDLRRRLTTVGTIPDP